MEEVPSQEGPSNLNSSLCLRQDGTSEIQKLKFGLSLCTKAFSEPCMDAVVKNMLTLTMPQ